MLVGVLKRNYLSLKYTHIQINESERSSRGQRGKFAFKFSRSLLGLLPQVHTQICGSYRDLPPRINHVKTQNTCHPGQKRKPSPN